MQLTAYGPLSEPRRCANKQTPLPQVSQEGSQPCCDRAKTPRTLVLPPPRLKTRVIIVNILSSNPNVTTVVETILHIDPVVTFARTLLLTQLELVALESDKLLKGVGDTTEARKGS